MACLEEPTFDIYYGQVIEDGVDPKTLDEAREIYVINSLLDLPGVVNSTDLDPESADVCGAERLYCGAFANFAGRLVTESATQRSQRRHLKSFAVEEWATRDRTYKDFLHLLGREMEGVLPAQRRIDIPTTSEIEKIRDVVDPQLKRVLYNERQALLGKIGIAG